MVRTRPWAVATTNIPPNRYNQHAIRHVTLKSSRRLIHKEFRRWNSHPNKQCMHEWSIVLSTTPQGGEQLLNSRFPILLRTWELQTRASSKLQRFIKFGPVLLQTPREGAIGRWSLDGGVCRDFVARCFINKMLCKLWNRSVEINPSSLNSKLNPIIQRGTRQEPRRLFGENHRPRVFGGAGMAVAKTSLWVKQHISRVR